MVLLQPGPLCRGGANVQEGNSTGAALLLRLFKFRRDVYPTWPISGSGGSLEAIDCFTSDSSSIREPGNRLLLFAPLLRFRRKPAAGAENRSKRLAELGQFGRRAVPDSGATQGGGKRVPKGD